MQKQGVLLINLGTPSAPSALSVASYLNTFLSDAKVIDLPYLLRQVLVKGLIVPFRTAKTLKAYRSIWTPAGSPLRVYMQALQVAVQEAFDSKGQSSVVALGMRYGEPSIQQGIAALREAGCTCLHIVPLYPQYAAATTGSALAVVLEMLKRHEPILPFKIYPPFYQDPGFIQAFAERIREHHQDQKYCQTQTEQIDQTDQANQPNWNTVSEQLASSNSQTPFTLFSYHGLPERQVRQMGCEQLSRCQQQLRCLKLDQSDSDEALSCYRAQCFMTTDVLVRAAGLNPKQTATAFQSRVGKVPWIRPYTDHVLLELAAKKIKRIVVVCPSFVVDCLETLEEIEIRAKAQWQALGGEQLSMVPSLNTHPVWVKTLVNWISAGD